jgi:hypothetical protein
MKYKINASLKPHNLLLKAHNLKSIKQRLTVAGRLIITVLIVGTLYFAFKMFGGQTALKKLALKLVNANFHL